MLPKKVYKQAYKDITKAYHLGKYTTQEWWDRIKAVYDEFEKDYPNQSLDLGY